MISPTLFGKTRSPVLSSVCNTVQATTGSARIEKPVLVSVSRAVRRSKSISDHRNPRTSPRRHPVRIINLVAAITAERMSSITCSAVAGFGGFGRFVSRTTVSVERVVNEVGQGTDHAVYPFDQEPQAEARL